MVFKEDPFSCPENKHKVVFVSRLGVLEGYMMSGHRWCLWDVVAIEDKQRISVKFRGSSQLLRPDGADEGC